MSEEEKLELTQEVQCEITINDEEADTILSPSFTLPGRDDIDDKRVLKNVKEVFNQFEFNCDDDFDLRFKTVEALSDFANKNIDDIVTATRINSARAILNRGACVARYWCVCLAINKALNNADYGTGAYEKLAQQLGFNRSYIYKLQKIATRVTLTQAYHLGIRGVDITTIRKLANDINDDAMRTAIINTFIDNVRNGGDERHRQMVLAQMKEAIERAKNQKTLELQNTDPATGAATVEVTPEYEELKKLIETFMHKFKPIADENLYEKLNNAAEDFYLMDDVPDAQIHLDTLKEGITALKTTFQSAVNLISDAMSQVDSLLNVSLTKAEDDDSSTAGRL